MMTADINSVWALFLSASQTSGLHKSSLPPYSPNLNLIERLWKLMRKKVINNRYYERFKDFRDAVLGFFENAENMKKQLWQNHACGRTFYR